MARGDISVIWRPHIGDFYSYEDLDPYGTLPNLGPTGQGSIITGTFEDCLSSEGAVVNDTVGISSRSFSVGINTVNTTNGARCIFRPDDPTKSLSDVGFATVSPNVKFCCERYHPDLLVSGVFVKGPSEGSKNTNWHSNTVTIGSIGEWESAQIPPISTNNPNPDPTIVATFASGVNSTQCELGVIIGTYVGTLAKSSTKMRNPYIEIYGTRHQYKFEIQSNNSTYGTVAATSPETRTGNGEINTYYGETVTITATPDIRYNFLGWDTDDDGNVDIQASACSSSVNASGDRVYTYTTGQVYENKKYVAIFQKHNIPVLFLGNPEVTTSYSSEDSDSVYSTEIVGSSYKKIIVSSGTVTVRETHNSRYIFNGWYANNSLLSSSSSYTISGLSSDVTVYAKFTRRTKLSISQTEVQQQSSTSNPSEDYFYLYAQVNDVGGVGVSKVVLTARGPNGTTATNYMTYQMTPGSYILTTDGQTYSYNYRAIMPVSDFNGDHTTATVYFHAFDSASSGSFTNASTSRADVVVSKPAPYEFTITVNPSGGTYSSGVYATYTSIREHVSDGLSFKYRYGTLVTLTTPEKSHHIFKGWSRSDSRGTLAYSTSEGAWVYTIGVRDETVTAIWEEPTKIAGSVSAGPCVYLGDTPIYHMYLGDTHISEIGKGSS